MTGSSISRLSVAGRFGIALSMIGLHVSGAAARWITLSIIAGLVTIGCKRSLHDMLAPLIEAPAESRPRVLLSNPSVIGGAYDPSLPIYVDFDRPMDASSTESAFSLSGSADTAGEKSWTGNRLIYTLAQPLQPGIAFVLRVNGSAKSADLAPMQTDYIVHFLTGSTIEAPIVLSHTPSPNAQAVPPQSAIVLVFSRPMNPESVERSFSLNPAVYGAFEWSAGNSIATFRPYSDLEAPTRYSVSLSTSAQDAEGIVLVSPLSFSFQTGDDLIRPTVLSLFEQGAIVALSDGYDGVEKESTLLLNFSEPMSPQDTERSVSIVRRSDGSSLSLQTYWTPTFSQLAIQPKTDLMPESEYRLTVSTSAKDPSGNALLTAYRIDFRVSNAAGAANSDYMELLNAAKKLPGDEQQLSLSSNETRSLVVFGSDLASSGTAGASAKIVLNFSHPIDPATIPESISISKALGPHPATGRILGFILQNNGAIPNARLEYTIGGLGEGNEYRLHISGGKPSNNRHLASTASADEHATYLEDDVVLNFRVEASP